VSSKAAAINIIPTFLRPFVTRVGTSPTGSRLVKGAFWSLSGALASRVLAIGAAILVARILGKTGFGELAIIQSTVGMFQVFAGFGLGLTATKYVSEYLVSDPQKVARIVSLSSVVALVTGGSMAVMLILFAPWLAARTLAAPHLTNLLRISAAMLFLGALTGAQSGVLAGFEKFKSIARINLVAGIAAFPLMLIGTYWAGINGAVWGLVGSSLVNWSLNFFALKSASRELSLPRFSRPGRQEYLILWKFSLPALLGGLMVSPALWICNAMLVNQPGGYGEMGIFNAANQWRIAILFLPGVVEAFILPVCSSLRGEGNWKGYKKVLLYNVYFNAAVTLVAAIVISFCAPLILRGYGNGFESGRLVLVVLCFAAALTAMTGVSGLLIASEDRMWSGLVLNLIWAITLIGSTRMLVSRGALGLALANLIAYTVHLVTVGVFAFYVIRRSQGNTGAISRSQLGNRSADLNTSNSGAVH
jgi:O-antigen/teichoic acid export membrane protein